MDVTPLVPRGHNILQSYKNGRFQISGKHFEKPVIVMPSVVLDWDVRVTNFKDFVEADFEPLLTRLAELDVVLLGGGAQIQFLQPDLKHALREKGLAMDVMDTGAACRTYNVLMAEGRRVAACLLPV